MINISTTNPQIETSVDYVEEFGDNFEPLVPPYTNRGGITEISTFTSLTALTPSSFDSVNCCIIDYLTVVFNIQEVHSKRKAITPDGMHQTIDDEVLTLILKLSEFVPDLEGQKQDKGLFGYTDCYNLTRGNQQAGKIAYGGAQKGTCMISLSGKGCSGVDMVKFRLFLVKLPEAHITRCDVARDDLEGKMPLDSYVEEYHKGGFYIKGTKPMPSNQGDWTSGKDVKGRTFYVGSIKNGKGACIYEKGKQLGDEKSPWVRAEVRFSNVDRVVPFDIITSPDMFFSASYPLFKNVCYFSQRIEVIKKQAMIAMEAMTNYASLSYGKLVNVMLEIGRTPEQIVQALRRDGCPKRLEIPYAPILQGA